MRVDCALEGLNMLLNKENLLMMLMEYVKERPTSYADMLVCWADFLNWLDTQRSRTPHETDTPTSGAIVSPDYAATADCSQCGESISWNGQYWVHQRSFPRHPGVPKSGTYRNPPHL